MHHSEILRTALETIKVRGEEYGDVLPSFARAASIAGNILDRKMTAFDVAVVMVAVKLSRLANKKEHQDSWVDLCAYVSFAAQFSSPHTSDFMDIVLAQVEEDVAKAFSEKVGG